MNCPKSATVGFFTGFADVGSFFAERRETWCLVLFALLSHISLQAFNPEVNWSTFWANSCTRTPSSVSNVSRTSPEVLWICWLNFVSMDFFVEPTVPLTVLICCCTDCLNRSIASLTALLISFHSSRVFFWASILACFISQGAAGRPCAYLPSRAV